MRLLTAGCEWKSISTMRDGVFSERFCWLNFSMALMKGVMLGTDFQQ